jgi:hypothetical protein
LALGSDIDREYQVGSIFWGWDAAMTALMDMEELLA